MRQQRDKLKNCKRVVIKVGSSLIANLDNHGIDTNFIAELVGQMAREAALGKDIVLVSSGAVAAGCVELGLSTRPTTLAELQAAAAVGQCTLMQIYKEYMNKYSITTAQVLLTVEDLKHRPRFLNSRNTLRELLNLRTIPIINENDTVAIKELQLKMGDNDALAVSVAQLIDADAVIILSDVPGLYDRPPSAAGAKLIGHVAELTKEHFQGARGSVSGVGSGGMSSKLGAALGAASGSIPLIIAEGKRERVINDILEGKDIGTFFSPRTKKTSLKKQWIAFSRPSGGKVFLDSGASVALSDGNKSLLPIGIRFIQGDFIVGDTVSIYDQDDNEIARGITNYSSNDAQKIIGKKSAEIENIFERHSFKSFIHIDNLVLL